MKCIYKLHNDFRNEENTLKNTAIETKKTCRSQFILPFSCYFFFSHHFRSLSSFSSKVSCVLEKLKRPTAPQNNKTILSVICYFWHGRTFDIRVIWVIFLLFFYSTFLSSQMQKKKLKISFGNCYFICFLSQKSNETVFSQLNASFEQKTKMKIKRFHKFVC